MRLAFNCLCFDLAEADSFYHIQTGRVISRLVEVRRLNDPTWVKKIIDYVVKRQNEDGGYTFAQGAESNSQDTYYGLSILRLLNTDFPNVGKTKRWLKNIDLDSVYSNYYVTKALLLCDEEPDKSLRERNASVISMKKYFGSVDVFSEVSSEFTTTFMALELADMLGIAFDKDEVTRWLLQFKNKDGGFGSHKHSNINSTCYAIASLNLLKWNIRDLRETVTFVRECEKPHGGFTIIPKSTTPYMEYTYYGVMTLDLLGEDCRYPAQTIDFVLRCQNANGGFARSDLGISTFENTFQAVSVLRIINRE